MYDDEQTARPARWKVLVTMSCGQNCLHPYAGLNSGADASVNPVACRMGELVAGASHLPQQNRELLTEK
jgi:hypothetical protein